MIDEEKMIHETVVRDVIDLVLNGLKNFNPVDAINNRKQNKSFRSIAAATQNLTLVFPCIASRNMSIETASMYSKAIERKAVSMLQMLFSAIAITNAEDGISYLRNFHTNLKLDSSMNIDKFMNMMDNLVVEGAIEITNEELYRKYSNDLKNLSNYLPDSIVESTDLSNYNIFKEPYLLEESYMLDTSKSSDVLTESIDYMDTHEYKKSSLKGNIQDCIKQMYTLHGISYDPMRYEKDPTYTVMIDKLETQATFNSKKKSLNEAYTPTGLIYDDRLYGASQVYRRAVDAEERRRQTIGYDDEKMASITPTGIAYDAGEYASNPSYRAKIDDMEFRQGDDREYRIGRDLKSDQNRLDDIADRERIRQQDRTDRLSQNNISNKHQSDTLKFQKAKHNYDVASDIRDYNHRIDREKVQDDIELQKQKYKVDQDKIRNDRDDDKLTLDKKRFNADLVRNNVDYLKNQLLDNDVKKSNELVPTTMIVNYISKGSDGHPIQSQTIIGVKAKLYPVNSDDVLKRIAIKHVDKNWLLGLVKATTREISFFRDFLFAVDNAKLDALSQSRKGSSSKLWKVLERRGIKSRVKRILGSTNNASAISSLAMTQEEVEYLKKMEDIDVENPKVIRPIMESYNLMCFAIFDETNEVAKFIFDTGDDIYEEMSFRLLEREDKGNDYRKIVNLMSKIR